MDPTPTAAEQLAGVTTVLGSLPDAMSDADRIDCIRQLEVVRGAVVAAQARITAAFVRSQRDDQRARGVPAARVGRGVTAQVALARRISPHRAERWVGFAMIAPTELPHTFAALAAGETSEWRATLVARETAWLSRDDRAQVDRGIAARLSGLGDRSTADETRKQAYALDPLGYVEQLARATADRHVSLRPAPDVMSRLSALLPIAQGVAVRAALGRAADTAKAVGDRRTRGQIMADTLVERCTGQATADAVGVEVQIVLPADVLFADAVGPAGNITEYTSRTVRADANPPAPVSLDAARAQRARRRHRGRDRRRDPAVLLGYGPIPAAIARRVILDRSAHAPTWLRRLYECPDTGSLVSMETRRRTFTAAQRAFIVTRDQTCRTPHCDAPIRHIDHVDPWAASHRTRIENGGGLCVACNHAKQAPGWRTGTTGAGRSPDIVITTPTGHAYTGVARYSP